MAKNIKINANQLEDAIFKIMEEYGDTIFQATQEGIDAAAKELANDLKMATPVDSGEAKKSWKIESKKYKLVRYVGNAKRVSMGRYNNVPWVNFIEYATKNGKPFIKRTFEANADKLARIVMNRIKKDA